MILQKPFICTAVRPKKPRNFAGLPIFKKIRFRGLPIFTRDPPGCGVEKFLHPRKVLSTIPNFDILIIKLFVVETLFRKVRPARTVLIGLDENMNGGKSYIAGRC